MQFIGTVEFYVIILLVAALAVAFIAVPAGHGPVETDFAEAILTFDRQLTDLTPRIELECLDDGTVRLIRIGIPDNLNNAATVAISITRKGFDLSAEERITPSAHALLDSETHPVNKAIFILPALAHDRYHLRYNSESTSTFTAMSFMNRPGLRITRIFRNA